VAGNGQDELLSALSGEHPAQPGMVILDGQDISTAGPIERRGVRVLSAPEERLGHAAAPDMSLTENGVLTAARGEDILSNGFIRWDKARAFAENVIKQFDVRTPGPDVAARALSGGNLQKFVVGREIVQQPDLLVINQPTWGVDAAAAAFIRQSILDLAAKGSAIVVISQDLDELMEVSDRFGALNEGRLSAPRPVVDLDIEQIGLMMGGAHDMEVAHADA
jgi:simple sugar transport system ATP-binding protein